MPPPAAKTPRIRHAIERAAPPLQFKREAWAIFVRFATDRAYRERRRIESFTLAEIAALADSAATQHADHLSAKLLPTSQ